MTTPAGTGTLPGGFTVSRPSPTVVSLSETEGVQGQELSVTITGTYFEGATTVSFGSGITTDNFTVDNDGQITADISISSTATAGTRTVSVTTPAGTGSKASGFEVKAEEKPAKSSNSGKIWIGVGVGLAVVALGAAIVYFVMRKRASQKAARPSRRK